MLKINDTISLPFSEIEFNQIRASGPGGQNVNKVATAVHLRFNIEKSSLPDFCKDKLLRSPDHRITGEGMVVIKAQQYRKLEQNKEDALNRLASLIRSVLQTRRTRKPTKPTAASRRKRLDSKQKQSRRKTLRKRVGDNE